MALIKDTTTNVGAIANYWRITNIGVDRILQKITFTIGLYLSKDAREAGSETFSGYDITENASYSTLGFSGSEDICKLVYPYAKGLEQFSGATDA